jgi:hypothetical protein
LEEENMLSWYRLRGNYPNYVTTRYFVYHQPQGRICSDFRGFLPYELEFQLSDESKPREITIAYLDGHMLWLRQDDQAQQLARLLVQMHRGDEAAKEQINRMRHHFCEHFKRHDRQRVCKENNYLVPSVTTTQYGAQAISHKGTMLLQLMQNGYPVPDFCILTSASYHLPRPQRHELLQSAIETLELMTGERLGDAANPLIFAMRCALPHYIPGMMPTYLNLGVTDAVMPGLQRFFGAAAAAKIRLNNLQTIYGLLTADSQDTQSPQTEASRQISWYRTAIEARDARLLEDALYQVDFALEHAHRFYQENEDMLFTFVKKGAPLPALILQKMVWTVRDDESYPGVLYSRHSRTGLGVQIESLRNIFGEEIMTGHVDVDDTEFFHRDEIKERFPAVYHFTPLLSQLEQRLGSPATVEFAAESGYCSHLFALLQLNCSELTGRATLLSAVDLHRKGYISSKRVSELFRPYHFTQIFSERIDDVSLEKLQPFCKGVSILPRSAVTARIYFSAEAAIAAKKQGGRVCLCQESFYPADTIVLGEVDAILSLTPAAIHVVTACRGYGIPAFINLEHYGVQLRDDQLINTQNHTITEGQWVTISSKRQVVYRGKASYAPARFQSYLEGAPLQMHPKEEKVFVNMARAWKRYQEIIAALDLEEISDLKEILKLTARYLKEDPAHARDFVNHWFSQHRQEYCEQILLSELGSHNEQHRLYLLLSEAHRIQCYHQLYQLCTLRGLSGFSAGSFMVGRFLGRMHPVGFWRAFSSLEVGFMLNEYILFEKYMVVLQEVGERQLNRARQHLLSNGMQKLRLTRGTVSLFLPLLCHPAGLDEIAAHLPQGAESETGIMLKELARPITRYYNPDSKWEMNQLRKICQEAHIPFCSILPDTK